MKSTKLENFQFPGDWKALRKYCEYLEKQVANNELAIAGLQGNIAGSKLREILWKIIGLATIGDVYVWGQDGLLGTKNELIDKALYIIKNKSKNNED